jgi:Na+-transporting NADH:ubiquinone oxidoreductase subunit A
VVGQLSDPDSVPEHIFISTFKTGPLTPDLNFIIEGLREPFQMGIQVLTKLTDGKVWLGLDANGKEPPSSVYTEAEGGEKWWFKGPHPAGNVGIQMHHIHPVSNKRVKWVLGVQEVVTLGRLFTEQKYNSERIFAITGAVTENPKYIRTFSGPKIEDLIQGQLINEYDVRIISGDVLSGEAKSLSGFINFYDDQLTIIEEGNYFELFGWAIPVKPRPSLSKSYPNFLFPDLRYKGDTNTHGEKRAFVVTGEYEKVLPMDIYPQHLMKAIIARDFERMEGLGIYELIEEDIALCEFRCTSKQPLQQILREGLDYMQRQG